MPDIPAGALTNRVRELRFLRGQLTQQQLAERAQVTRQTIIALEAGKYAPSLLLAFRLAAALGVRLEEVFQYDGASRVDDSSAQ